MDNQNQSNSNVRRFLLQEAIQVHQLGVQLSSKRTRKERHEKKIAKRIDLYLILNGIEKN